MFGCEYPFGWLPPFAYNQKIFLQFKQCIIESDYLELSLEKFCATRTGLVGKAVNPWWRRRCNSKISPGTYREHVLKAMPSAVSGWLSLLRRTYLCEEQYDHYLRWWVLFPVSGQPHRRTMVQQDEDCQVLNTRGDCHLSSPASTKYLVTATYCVTPPLMVAAQHCTSRSPLWSVQTKSVPVTRLSG